MATIEISIKDNIHRIACNDGEEDHLKYLVSKFNTQIIELTQALPNADDKTLYLIAGLTLIDKLEEIEKNNKLIKTKSNNVPYDQSAITSNDTSEFINNVTNKLEKLIQKLEKK